MSFSDSLKWTTKASLPAAKSNAAADYVNGKLYVIDGTGFSNSILVYDVGTNAWRTDAQTDLTARADVASTVDASGRIYLIDGVNGSGKLATVTRFDPFNDTITQLTSTNTARDFAAAATGANGKIYVFGGINSSNTVLNTGEVYDPNTNLWTAIANIPQARAQESAVAVGSKIYIMGGEDSGLNPTNTLYAYDTVANTWSTLATMPTLERGATAGVVNGEIVVAGGITTGGSTITTTQIYDPARDTWTTGSTNMTTGEAFAGQGMISSGSQIFVSGGNTNNTALQVASVTTPADVQILYRINHGQFGEIQLGNITGDGTGRHTIYFGGGGTSTQPPTTTGSGDEQAVAVDPAYGLVFSTGPYSSSGTQDSFTVHNLNTGAVISTTSLGPHTGNVNNDDVVQSLAINVFTHTLYVADWGSTTAVTGFRQYTYDNAGNLTPLATNNGFLVKASVNASITDPLAMFVDNTNHKLYWVDDDGGYNFSPFSPTNGVFVLDLNSPNTSTELTSNGSGTGQFPTATGGIGTIGAHGNLLGLAVDVADNVVFFTSTDNFGSANNALWWVNTTGAGQTATKVTLPAGVTFNFAGQTSQGDMSGGLSFDPVTKNIYLSDASNSNVTPDTGHLYVLHWDNATHSVSLATSFDTASLANKSPTGVFPTDAITVTNLDNLPALTTSGTSTHATEQSATKLTLLASTPSITDADGDHLVSATVQITGGQFIANETSANDDHLTIAVASRAGTDTSGTVNGTSISYTYNSATETLTLSGYDTEAHYQTALAAVQYFTTGDNPTDYGLSTTRTITWQVNDGAVGNPSGTNTTTTVLSIDAVNDAPVNAVPAGTTGNEDQQFAITGLSVSDVDANPATPDQKIIFAVTVLHGTLSVLTNIANGVTAGEVVGSGTKTVTLTATQNEINNTIAGNGLLYLSDANYNGPDTATVTTNDQGHTGSGGAQQVSNQFSITINPVDDPPAGTDNTVTILEDHTYTFTAADFGFSDPIDAANGVHGADSFLAVKVTTLPTAGTGTLTDNGVAVSAGQFVSVTDINANKLVFTPGADKNGLAEASFTFQVQDNGTTANGGIDTDQSPNTFTFNVTSVNDAPAGADNTKAILEDASYTFAAADFGFTDTHDTPANNLLAVEITTLPTAGTGTLTDNGVAVTAGQFVSVADINANKLVFTPAANKNGSPEASFTFQVQDDGGTSNGGVDTDQSPNTFTFNVTSVNDAPQGTDTTKAILEDATYTFAAVDFGFSDPNDTPANTLQAVKITTLATAGTLTDNNVAVTTGQFISLADITGGKLKFAPATDANGTPYSSFTFQVQDNGGTANGGVDLDQSANTFTFNVTSVNDAPAGTDNNKTINEDATYTFATADFGFSDVHDSPANNLQAVEITTLPTNGTLTDNGSTFAAGTFIPVADITGGKLVFAPVANANGTPYSTFTFQVQDDGGTNNSGVDTDQSANTFTFNVNSVNDAPQGTDNTQTILEDHTYTFGTADFGFSDPNDTPANTIQAVEITTLPSGGTLTDNGVAVTSGQFVSAADISGGKLVFTPTANANGTPETSFTFQVQDNGGTANGGVDTDQSPNTFTFDVTSVNDAPAGTDATIQITAAAGDHTFTAADFGFTDPNDSPANNFLDVKIDTLPNHGVLKLNGTPVAANDVIQKTDIDAGNLKFTPDTGFPGPDAGLTFQVQDDGGTTNGGIDLDPTPNTLTLNVKVANQEPVGTDGSVAVHQDTPYHFAAADFGFTDPNDTPPNHLLAVEITTVPGNGTLTDNGNPVTATQFIPVADINAGLLVYAPNSPDPTSPPVFDTFTFQVQDDGGTANSGQDTDQTANTLSVNIVGVNHEPVGTDGSNSTPILEDTSYTFHVADFGFSDPNDTPADHFQAVEITTTPSGGTITDNGVGVSAGQFVSVNDIAANKLVFTPTANANGTPETSFTFQVQDDGGTANGGVDTDQTPNTFTFNVTAVNDAPAGTDNAVTTNEDTPYTFTDADFGFTDPSDSPANNLANVEITTLPGTGSLTDNGVAVVAGQFVTEADISGGKLVFTPVANANGTPYSTFTFQVQDDGGTANGGVDTDQSANTLTVNVNSVNDEPAGADKTVTTAEDTPYTFAAADFGFTDPNDSPANNLANVEITTLPVNGALTDDGVPVVAGQFVSAADINANKLVFTPAPDANGSGYASFTFQVQDDGGTNFSGVDTDQTPNTITVDVTSVNDAPKGTNNTVTTNEDTAYTFTTADFGFTDPNDTPADSLAAVEITTVPGAGSLTDNGVAVSAGQFVSVADINGGKLVFTPAPDANGSNYANFTFQVEDNGGTANGGVDTDPAPKTMIIDVTAVNDAPAGTDNSATILEDHTYTFATADFGFSDPNDSPANALQAVEITTLPAGGTITDNGVAVAAGQFVSVADISGGKLAFTPTANANGTPETSFTFQVQDDGGIGNGGVDTDATPNTFTFNVTSVNDEPAGKDNTVTTNEDTAYTFAAADFGFTDPNDSPANALLAVEITTLPGAGSLKDNGVAVTAGQFVTVGDITGGKLVFTPAPDANGVGYASFTFQVQDNGGILNGGVDTDQSPNTMTVNVTPVNDPSVLANVAPNASYPPGSPPVDLSPGTLIPPISITDIDSTTLTGATVVITNGSFLGDQLAVNGQTNGPIPGLLGINAVYNPGNFTLTLTGTDTLAHYAQALEEVTFQSLNGSPTNNGLNASRTLDWQVNDGGPANNLSNIEHSTINLHVLDLDGNDSTTTGTSFAGTFTEHGPAVPIADTDVVINDPDTGTMTQATVTLTNAKTNDSLGISGALPAGIASSVDTSVPGQITLTLSGASSTANYQTALHEVVFSNSSSNPDSSLRDLSVVVTDSLNDATNPALSNISMVLVNDPPVVNPNGGSLFYAGNQAPSPVDSALTVSDVDSISLVGATVSITGNFHSGEDVLGFTNQNGITGNYNSGAGVLTLTGSATLANYQTALESVTYSDNLSVPTAQARTVSWQVDDGAAQNNLSTIQTSQISVASVTISGLTGGNAVEATPVTATINDSGTIINSATYTWKANGTTVQSGSSNTYTPIDADEAKALTLDVSFTDPNNVNVTDHASQSAGTVQENPNENAAIAISGLSGGNAVEGTQLTATVTEADAPGSGITYTWTVNGTTVKSGVDAAGNTYTPTEANEGLPIGVSVSFTDTHGNAGETGSASAGTVQENPNENAAVTLSGLVNGHPQEAKQLNATVTESDAPASGITYTWTANGTVVKTGVDAAGNTYTPTQNEDGKNIAVSVSFTDTHGFAEHGSATAGVVGGLTHLGAGDYDSDGDANGDLLWQNADGSVVTWDMNGAQISGQTTLGQVPSNWHFVGTGQFTAGLGGNTGNSEAFFQSDDGHVLLWQIVNNHVTVNQIIGQTPSNWHVFGTGDVNGDGKSDVLFQSDAGAILEWQVNGTNVQVNQIIGQAPAGDHAVALADFNHDGNADILFQNDNGNLDMWLLNGTQVIGSATPGQIPSNWHFATTGDFNGDGRADVLFRSDAGGIVMWEMNGTQVIANQLVGQVPPNWSVSGTADVNGDGKSDVIFTSDAGNHQLWEMNGTQVIADLPIGPNGTPASPPLQAHTSSASASAADLSAVTDVTSVLGQAGGAPGAGGWLSAPDPGIGSQTAMPGGGAGGSGASVPGVNLPSIFADHVGGFLNNAGITDALSSLTHDQHFLV